MPDELHAGAVESGRLMIEHPCGLWQISPVHYRRGFARHMGVTAFPLRFGERRAFQLLGILMPVETLLRPMSSRDSPLLYETASIFEFIDFGAGTPVWPTVPTRPIVS
ncbi:MAG: hypothetical protein HY243_08165 [Proteobacteria bacterium]|nr:hypothetical protein [Pseudomonadota bacterium]